MLGVRANQKSTSIWKSWIVRITVAALYCLRLPQINFLCFYVHPILHHEKTLFIQNFPTIFGTKELFTKKIKERETLKCTDICKLKTRQIIFRQVLLKSKLYLLLTLHIFKNRWLWDHLNETSFVLLSNVFVQQTANVIKKHWRLSEVIL